MTHFKLYLLTPQFRNNVTVFAEDQITEFYAQTDQDQSRQVLTIQECGENVGQPVSTDVIQNERKKLWENNHNSFSYSYNEKIAKEQNAQKTLTFEMNRYIVTTNEWRENPFARNIMIGSILLLREYRFQEVGEEALFTVTSIKYDPKQNNTIYSITCQDTFTYQSARQNENYEIKNDPNSSDFIGAKTIDWWIINKIVPECHMNYQYLSMQTGLYLTKQGHYYTYDIGQQSNIIVPNNEEILKIVKEPYSPTEDKDYFELFSFSCSGSNANAALIELANLINFQINTFEHVQNNSAGIDVFDQFFWVEPKQNDKRLGLEYSPAQSIKNFGLTHKGDSLTTVLAVNGPTIDDDIITLIPSVPPFFSNIFLSGATWDKSSFNTGYFSSLCKEKLFMNYSNATADANANIFTISTDTIDIPNLTNLGSTPEERSFAVIKQGLFYDSENDIVCGWFDTRYRYFPLYTQTPIPHQGVISPYGDQYLNFLFNVPNWYDLISFTYNETPSRLIKYNIENFQDVVYQNNNSHWEIVLHDLESNQIITGLENITSLQLLIHNYRLFIRIRLDADITTNEIWTEPAIFIRFYRHPSTEELEFATIADQCPWLENKIIDFSYFHTNRIINDSEYKELLNILSNQLRIVNGKLLIYAQSYYNALHQETEILAKIQEKLDVLGAECQASIIDPCAASNAPVLDLSQFQETYLNITTNDSTHYTAILNHTSLLEEYFAKYFNAQQRFLKNIKAFRDYFHAPVNFAAEGLYKYTLSITSPNFETLLLQQADIQEGSDDDSYTTNISFYSFANAKFKNITNTFKYYVGYGEKRTWNGNNYIWENDDDQNIVNYGDPQLPIYQYNEGSYIPISVASKRNYKDLYVPDIKEGDLVTIGENEVKGYYDSQKQYYQAVFSVPVVRDDLESDWYLEGDNSRLLRIGITSSLTYSANPGGTDGKPWQGFYKITRSSENLSSESLYVVALNIKIDKNDQTKGSLLLSILPYDYGLDIEPYDYSNNILNSDWLKDATIGPGDPITDSINPCHIVTTPGLHPTIRILDYGGHEVTNITTTKTIFQPITKKEAINNYIYRSLWVNYPSVFSYRDAEFYTDIPNGIPSWFRNYTKRSLVTSFAKGDDAIINNTDAQWDDDDLYVKYFPVTNVYYFGPKYKVVSSIDNSAYYFKRLNKKGEDQKVYYESIINGESIENPYNYEEYQPISFVSYNNENTFYRRIYGTVSEQIWDGVDVGLNLSTFNCIPWTVATTLGAGSWDAYHSLWIYGPACFSKEGFCNKDFFGDACSDTNLYSHWHDWSEIVYALAENSYETYSLLTTAAINANSYIDPLPMDGWDDSCYQYIASTIRATEMVLVPTSELEKKDTDNPIFYATIGEQIGLTLSSAKSLGLQIPGLTGTLLSLEDELTKDGNYKVILWNTIDSDVTSNFLYNPTNPGSFYTAIGGGHSFDLNEYYPLGNIMVPLDISQMPWTESKQFTLAQILSACKYDIIEDEYTDETKCYYHLSLQNPSNGRYNKEYTVSFIKISNYNLVNLALDRGERNFALRQYPIDFYSASKKIYNTLTDNEYDFDKEENLMVGYYYIADKDDSFKLVSDLNPLPDFDRSEIYYDQNLNRIYTIYQLMYEHPFTSCYLQCQEYTEESLVNNVTSFSPILVKNTAQVTYTKDTTDLNNPRITSYIINKFITNEDSNIYTFDFEDSSFLQIIIDKISFLVEYEKQKVSDIYGLTNGAFWYLYCNSSNHPLLLQHAAIIESQLSEYWQTAYAASKNCEFFLPEHWQPVYDTKANKFAASLFTVTYDNNDANLILKVNNKLIPEVKVVQDNKNGIILPRYQFKRANNKIVYTPTNASGSYIDSLNTESAEKLADNEAIVNIMKNLKEDLSNWIIEKNGNTTYYYAIDDTGMHWNDFLYEATKIDFPLYSGQYLMLYNILKEQYYELPMTQYLQLQKQHDHLWQTLYNKYQFMVLQNKYENETATSSRELLQMAQYAFKNLNKPEAEYSLSILNASELKGYYGQEVRIGDGIKIDAQAYYNEYDQIYNSLSQYLFISKISYSLRNPIDISLTVNDVQYEDKIVQRLVKLIK